MALSTGSVDKPQCRVRGLQYRADHLVLRCGHIQGLDVKWFPPVGSRETYVPFIFCAHCLMVSLSA